MTDTINLPLPDGIKDRVDKARGNTPRVRWIREAIELRLDAPSIIEMPMKPLVAPLRGGSLDDPRPANPVPMPAEVKEALVPRPPRVDPEICDHKWRSPAGKCFACGDER